MVAKSKKNDVADQEPEQPQVPPRSIGSGHPEYHFVASVMELQKSITEVSVNQEHLIKTVDGIKTQVSDLVKWKHMIFGGVVVIGIILSGVWVLFKELKNDFELVTKAAAVAPIPSNPTAMDVQQLPEQKNITKTIKNK